MSGAEAVRALDLNDAATLRALAARLAGLVVAAPGRFMKAAAAARYLGVSASTLANWRVAGRGPGFVHPDGIRSVIYDREELDRWLAGNRRSSTTDAQPEPASKRREKKGGAE